MALKWNHKDGSISAVGKQARYTITDYKLTAVGFDGLPLLSLPPYGAIYPYEFEAMCAAEEVDAHEYFEAQMGVE